MSAQWEAFTLLLSIAAPCFTQPSFAIFTDLIAAWVACPSRHTVTGLIRIADPEGRRAHDAYHRFFRDAAWRSGLWRVVATAAVGICYRDPAARLVIDVDDTLFHKSGRKVDGASMFRDAIASTHTRLVFARGLNVVVVTLRVNPPWGGEPLALPINFRLYRKGGQTLNELAGAMVGEIASWFPERRLVLCGDGYFAPQAARRPGGAEVVSRMRRNAKLYELPPPRTPGQRGRPRVRGQCLPRLEEMAASARWEPVKLQIRAKRVKRQVWSRTVVWYGLCRGKPVRVVVVRDPAGIEPDDYFFTTDLDASPVWVVETYAGRWSIEDTFRNTKQFLRGEDPQCWKRKGPQRAAAVSFWVYSIVWLWYLQTQGTARTWTVLPWYQSKATPSFLDALASLRRVLWRQQIFATSTPEGLSEKFTDTLVETLAQAA